MPHVLEQIDNFPNPFYKGYYAFHEAIKEVRNYLGPNYFVSKNIKPIDRIVPSSSKSIHCNHCEALAKQLKNLMIINIL